MIKKTVQQKMIEHNINDGNNNILVINAISGGSKTTSIVMGVNSEKCKFKNGLVLAFNAKIAKENKNVFPDWCEVRTIHSLGYKYVVGPKNLKVKSNVLKSDFKGSDKQKGVYVSVLNAYCNSEYISLKDFIENETNVSDKYVNKTYDAIKSTISDMENGVISISHSVYIKLFHIYLHYGDVKIGPIDFLFMDEFADVNGCYYQIFLLINAKKKVAVGDSAQSIYQFNNSIDGLGKLLDEFPDKTIELSLSTTFRCSKEISEAVQLFMYNYIDKDMVFDSNNDSNTYDAELNTFAYITRTNKELISEALNCVRDNIKFSFARSVSSIFKPYLYMRSGVIDDYDKYIKDGNLNNIDKEHHELVMLYEAYKMVLGRQSFPFWLHNKARKDSSISEHLVRNAATAKLFTVQQMISVVKYLEDKKNQSDKYVIGTGFSTKGISIDSVYICDDIYSITENELDKEIDGDYETTERFLAYVACTRAKYKLVNAKILDIQIGNDTKPGKYTGLVRGSDEDYESFIADVKASQSRRL